VGDEDEDEADIEYKGIIGRRQQLDNRQKNAKNESDRMDDVGCMDR
jgi:hypothetical protein